MKELTSHKSLGMTFKNDFTKLFIIGRNKTVTVLVYTFVVVNERVLFFLFCEHDGFDKLVTNDVV
jgi:hypothetical protein